MPIALKVHEVYTELAGSCWGKVLRSQQKTPSTARIWVSFSGLSGLGIQGEGPSSSYIKSLDIEGLWKPTARESFCQTRNSPPQSRRRHTRHCPPKAACFWRGACSSSQPSMENASSLPSSGRDISGCAHGGLGKRGRAALPCPKEPHDADAPVGGPEGKGAALAPDPSGLARLGLAGWETGVSPPERATSGQNNSVGGLAGWVRDLTDGLGVPTTLVLRCQRLVIGWRLHLNILTYPEPNVLGVKGRAACPGRVRTFSWAQTKPPEEGGGGGRLLFQEARV